MDIQDFFNHIEEHESLEGVSITGEGPEAKLVVRYKPTGLKTELALPPIKENTWDDLCAVLEGRREPDVLYHITRVIGYYSRTENWNRSKLGELKARHAGDYAIPTA